LKDKTGEWFPGTNLLVALPEIFGKHNIEIKIVGSLIKPELYLVVK